MSDNYVILQIFIQDQISMIKSNLAHKMKICIGLSPLLMQNSYLKLILAITTLSVDSFSKFLLVLLGQIEIKIVTTKYSSCLSTCNVQQKIISESSLSDVRFYTLHVII